VDKLRSVVRYAVGLPNVGEFADVGLLRDLAVDAEQAGWDGVYVWDHLLYHDTEWPAVNPTVAAAAIAARTSRIRVIVACTLARRRVQVVARETVSLDRLSGGRLTLVTPLGSAEAEFAGFGEPTDLPARGAALTRSLDELVMLWSAQPVTLARGDRPVRLVPGPQQQPRIPIWVGGRWPNRAPLRRAARFDGAMPTFVDQRSRMVPPAEFAAATRYLARHRPTGLAGYDLALEGTSEPDTAADLVESYVDAGLTWWVEAMGWWRVPAHAPAGTAVAAARDRISAGPVG
jgi:alkanesulfonate monooxygenase SsuD/methylene tetrahydromethanopterin reductase-like flavin-dependent oxidoreductase (luciferase family)